MNADCVKYGIGDKVYHLTEPEKMGIVIGIIFYPGGFYYDVQWGIDLNRKHYDCELTAERGFSTVSE